MSKFSYLVGAPLLLPFRYFRNQICIRIKSKRILAKKGKSQRAAEGQMPRTQEKKFRLKNLAQTLDSSFDRPTEPDARAKCWRCLPSPVMLAGDVVFGKNRQKKPKWAAGKLFLTKQNQKRFIEQSAKANAHQTGSAELRPNLGQRPATMSHRNGRKGKATGGKGWGEMAISGACCTFC